jgi:hypothetical protein
VHAIVFDFIYQLKQKKSHTLAHLRRFVLLSLELGAWGLKTLTRRKMNLRNELRQEISENLVIDF